MQEKSLTYEQLIHLFSELRDSQAKTDAQLAKTDAQLAKTDAQLKESQAKTDAQLAETRLFIKNLGKEIGNLGNSFGRYTEGLLGPSIRKILNQLGAEGAYANFTDPKKNKYEFDYIGTVNGSVNKVFLVEVKNTLSEEHIAKFIEKLKNVSNDIPDFKGKKVIGAIATISYLKEDRLKALESGLYFMHISNDIAKLDTPKNFKPREF